MSSIEIGFACLALSVILLLCRVYIGLAMGLAAIVGLFAVVGPSSTLAVLKTMPFEFAASWELSAIPMFILMGNIAYHTGMTGSLFQAARAWFGFLPGGLAVATNMACAGFAAASGSSLATTIAMGRIAVPEMRRYNYDAGLATGVVAAAGTLGSLIPPSILLVLYGIFSKTSISALFLAGILPGLLTAAIYTVMIVIRCMADPRLAPRPPERPTWRERFTTLIDVWPLPLLVLGVIGSIYSGFATATEAGAVGTVLALLISLVRRDLSLAALKSALSESLVTSAAIFFIALGAVLMTKLMAFSGLPAFLADAIQGWAVSPIHLILATSVIYLIMGCFIDPIGMVLLTLPILVPLFTAMKIDLIWFGILVVKFVEIGLITPPLGLNVFAAKALAPDVPMQVVFKGALWFGACEVVVVGLLVMFPEIALYLTRTA